MRNKVSFEASRGCLDLNSFNGGFLCFCPNCGGAVHLCDLIEGYDSLACCKGCGAELLINESGVDEDE